MFGLGGKVAWINLSNNQVKIESTGKYKKFIGGRGVGSYLVFKEVPEGNITKTIPKKTLKIDLVITVSYNPIFANLFKYTIEDNYFIEWGSRKNYPNFEDHPVFKSWNKRNDEFYIYKIAKAVQEVKIIKNDDDDISW